MENKEFKEVQLDPKDYEKEGNIAKLVRGIAAATVTIGGAIIAGVKWLGKNNNDGDKA